jgi:hypothetical protein
VWLCLVITLTVGSGACVSGKRRIDGFLMGYFGGIAGSVRTLLQMRVEAEVSDEVEDRKVLLMIRLLIRALRSAICGMSMFGITGAVLLES